MIWGPQARRRIPPWTPTVVGMIWWAASACPKESTTSTTSMKKAEFLRFRW
jgi:hypothetical protein